MTTTAQAPAIQGRTIRFIWTEGPTKGKTHEHVFHQDGTVEWHDAGAPKGQPGKERPKYAALPVADEVYLVSYLADSGYTLTTVLNFRNQRLVGIASGAKEWFPVEGTFEVVK
jgi:molybdenum cofactor biosynthesis protein MoaF